MTNRVKEIIFGTLCFLAGAVLMTLASASSVREVPSARYQVSAMGLGAFVLDTQTGHLWCTVSTQGGWESHNLGKIPEYGIPSFEEMRGEAERREQPKAKE